MKLQKISLFAACVLLLAGLAQATIFGDVRGIVHDPQHRPIEGAQVMIRAQTSDWSKSTQTDANGEFEFTAVPAGDYAVVARAEGFETAEERVEVTSGTAPLLHLQLGLAALSQKIEVSATPQALNTEPSSPPTLVTRAQISRTPGADRTNSLAMIADYVPGAVIVHDQIHIRGGHQTSWMVDGVPVPNTNIASNVGPQFDPQDVDYIETRRGGYSAEYGDRAYGVFNVVTRSGFERNNEGELVTSLGNFNETDDYLSFGSHTARFAYYTSLNGNRSELGLLTPTSRVIHDPERGLGGFVSLIFNATPRDQVRLVSSLRKDHYQIPNTPDQQAAGIRDLDREVDAFVNFSWVRTLKGGALFTVSPFYHFNRADLVGGPGDMPLVTNDNRASNYAGVETTLGVVEGKHNAHMGFEAFNQWDNTFFGLRATDGSGVTLSERVRPAGNFEAIFLEDQYKLQRWITLNGGLRLTRYAGQVLAENADPRVGAAVAIPRLGWILRGYYGRYSQPPPLDTVSGPLARLAVRKGFAFLPLHPERDEQHEVGLTVPFRGWAVDVDRFHTRARNYFDHDVLGNSNIFLPVAIELARLHGWEATLRSPQLLHLAQLRVAYSHQYAQARGGVRGGLTDFSPPGLGYFFLDHDQRNTFTSVLSLTLPARAWAAVNLSHGSGFLNGDGPAHLPAHTTIDVSLGKSIHERWSVALTALNLANRRYLLDNSNTFGGTHFSNPRQVAVEVRYRFHF